MIVQSNTTHEMLTWYKDLSPSGGKVEVFWVWLKPGGEKLSNPLKRRRIVKQLNT